MALPSFLYGDPSNHIDHIRKERKKYEARQPVAKREQAREGLKALFGEGKKRDAR